MALRLVTNDQVADAYSALSEHREAIEKVQREGAAWVAKEEAELHHIRACTAAQNELTALEQRRVDALADRAVLGHCADDVEELASQIEGARTKAAALTDQAALSAAMVIRIRAQRDRLRADLTSLNAKTRELQHAAREERLAFAMKNLVEAEERYVLALELAFGVAASIDELARAPGVQLAFAGQLPLADLLLPRPYHEAFAGVPSPQRPNIAAAIVATANGTALEL